MSAQPGLRLMLVAGEPSGDELGAGLLRELRALSPANIEAFGVGGAAMARLGHKSLFPMAELSVMGLAEVLPRLLNLRKRIAQTAAMALRERPDALITIDSPDFNFRVAARVRRQNPGIPILHYVAPQVWAWRRGRARKMALFIDHLLALLPFEPPIFDEAGLACTFVGHPAIERGAGPQAGAEFRRRHNIPAEAPLLAVLPGSRHSETSRLLPVFGQAIAMLVSALPDLHLFCASVPGVASEVTAAAAGWQANVILTRDAAEKVAGFAACDAAIAASGTVSLELAVTQTPHVIAYRVNPLTALIARRVLKISQVNLINLVVNETVIPELLQEACTAAKLTGAVLPLLQAPRPSPAAQAQRDGMRRALGELGQAFEPPSRRAARAAMEFIEHSRRR